MNQVWRKKTDDEGEPLIENGDFVMELVSEIESEEPVVAEKPNWLKLEQELRYFNGGALFGKALATATPNPFSIFLKTLENGDKGIASENALAFAFSILGVDWTTEEIGQLNTLLQQNNFTIRL